MSAIGQLWFKWVSDPTKLHTIDMVPSFWRKEVEGLMQQKEAKEEAKWKNQPRNK